MKLHLPCLLRRALLALVAPSALLPVSAVVVSSDYARVCYHYSYKLNSTTGGVTFSPEEHWLNNVSVTVKKEDGTSASLKTYYEPRYAEALRTATLVTVTQNEETGKYSASAEYVASFLNQVDGNGKDYIKVCSTLDESGNAIAPGVWILSPSGCGSSDVFFMRNYGDILISDSRQQYNYYKPKSVTEEGKVEYETIVMDYLDKPFANIVVSGTSPYSKSVQHVGFGLDVCDSGSFTYTRAYTADNGSFSSGTHDYVFTNVNNIEFSDNTAGQFGGVIYGSNWSFYVESAENVRFLRNSAGKGGSVAYGGQSSVWSGGHRGGFQICHVTGEVLFEGNRGSCMFRNVNTQFADINKLTFNDNTGVLFYPDVSSLYVEMTNCKEVTFSGNGDYDHYSTLFTHSASSIYGASWTMQDCGNVTFSGNKCQYYLAEACTPHIVNVDNVVFEGNCSSGGTVLMPKLFVENVRESLRIDGNIGVNESKNSSNGALFSGNGTGSVTANGAEEKYAALFSLCSNRASGLYSNGFLNAGLTLSRFENVLLNDNVFSGTVACKCVFGGVNVSDVHAVSVSGNNIQSPLGLSCLFDKLAVDGYDVLSVSGNTLTAETSSVGTLWKQLDVSAGGGKAQTLTISDNHIQGYGNSQTQGAVKVNGAEQMIVSGNSIVITNEAPTQTSSACGVLGSQTSSTGFSSVNLAQIGTVEISGNSVSHMGAGTAAGNALGGAMCGNVILENIDTLTFSGNHAYATDVNGYASGGAAYIYTFKSLSQIGTITFDTNIAGGEDGGFAMEARGGALHTRSDLANENGVGSLRFAGNAARGKDRAYGGAAYFYGGCNLSVTKELVFTDNAAESGEAGDACGGALYLNLYRDSAKISSSGTMEFRENSVRGFSVGGGALYCAGSNVALSAEQELLLQDNTADAGETGSAVGGAVYSTSSSSFSLSGGKVTIVGNSARGLSAMGGAIYAQTRATLTNSDLLVMRGNYVRTEDGVVLNDIHMGNTGTSTSGNLNILFNEGQRAEIYDSVNARVLNLNTNAANTGTILFSGAYTETDLAALKADYTQEEVDASRRIYASAGMSLSYGELQVREGMKMVSDSTFKQAATAHMTLHDAAIVAKGALTTTAVHFSGANVLSSATSLAGSTWTLSLGAENKENAVLTLDGTKSTGAITMGALTGISLEFDEDLTTGTYKLISFDTSKVTWSSLSKTALSGGCQSLTVGSGTDVRLLTEGNTQTLVFDYVAPARPATTLTWGGGNGTWQQGETSAWTGSVKDLTFRNGDSIVFDKGGSVTLIGELSPAAVSVSGTSDLSLSGSGSLTGTSTLTKNGSGKLTISTANTYTGGTTLNGGTLEVANARALGSGAVTMTGGTLSGTLSGTTIQASGGDITAELTGSNSITGANFALSRALRNGGTLSLSGSFSADNLELRHSDATRVDVNGSFGAAGFAKAAFDAVTVVNGGSVINKGATVTHGSLSLELGSDGVATRGGAVNLSEYLLVNGTAATSSAIHAKSATAGVTMNGGTLTADDAVQVTATGGALVLNGGSLSGTLNNVTLTMTNGSLNTSLGGSSTLIGNHYTLTKALSNTGTLRVSGSLDASALNLNTTGITHVDVNGVSGASGFTKYGDSSVTLITGGTVVNEGALITHGNLSLTLGSDGVARTAGATVYDTYLLTTGASVTSSAVHAKAAGASITQTGGTLTVNDTATVNATAGNISLSGGTLNGTLSGTSVTATGGTLAATMSGNNTLTGQSYAVQSAISNRGTLTVSGSFDASALTLNTIAATHVDVNGMSGASGFAKEADRYVTLVNGGTVINQGAVVTHGGLQLTLAADGTAKSTGATDGSLYLLTGRDSVSTSAVHAKSAGAAVSMTGGTLTVNDRASVSATAGVVNLNGGTLVGSLATSNDLRLNVQQTSSMEGSLTLGGGTTELHGTLNLNGTLALVSATTLDVSSFTRVGDYTLIRANDISGDMSLLSCAPTSAKMAYTLSRAGNDLKLLVSRLSENHLWGAPKGTIDGRSFAEGDTLEVVAPAAITLSGKVNQGGVTVDTVGKVTFTSDKKTPGSGFGGDGALVKNGEGLLTMNAGNTYTGGTTLNAGTLKATAVDSFGSGVIVVKGGTLDLGSKAVANPILLSGEATLKGDAKYAGIVTVDGDATLLAKTSFKGQTTIGTGSSLTLAPKAGMAGNIFVNGGDFIITAPKGLTLGKNQIVWLYSGSIKGQLTLGSGSWLSGRSGSLSYAPVLKGGGIDLGAESYLQMSGSKANVKFGGLYVELPGKGIVYTDADLVVNSGTVTVNSMGGYSNSLWAQGGTLKLSTGKMMTENNIVVNGTAAVVNGSTHYGNIIVTESGLLAKGTNIKLLDENQKVELNGEGAMLGTISGKGIIDVNADINATAAKLTAATINLNGGTFTNTKGIKLAKGQTLTLAGASLELGPKGALATVAGSTLIVSRPTDISGSLTLGGGELVFENGDLNVSGTLTLSKAMTVTGSGTIHYTMLKAAKNVDVVKLFGEGAELDKELCTLTFSDGASLLRSAAAPLATAEEAPAQPDATPAIPVANPVADAMVQADWGILDAERAFMGAVNSRHQHAALLDKGRGAAWVSAFGASVRHGNQGTHHGSDGNIEGAAFGLEHAVSDTGTLGLAVGRSKNRLAATGVTHLRQETAHVALYGQKQLKHGFTADASAAYGDTETKLGAASWQQKSAALSARLTHAKMLSDATAFRTFGGLSYEATDAGSIATVHTGSVQNLRAELGAGATHTLGKAHLYAEAALTGDVVRHNPTVDFGGVRTHGANPGRIGLRATVGGIYEFTDTWSGTASYGIEAESRSTAHTLNIGVSKTF